MLNDILALKITEIKITITWFNNSRLDTKKEGINELENRSI